MHPMAQIVEGRVTLETPAGNHFTWESLKDLHTRAMMAGIPTNATITRIAWHLRQAPTDPQQVSVYYVVQDQAPFVRMPEEGPVPQIPPHPAPQTGAFPNPLTTQKEN